MKRTQIDDFTHAEIYHRVDTAVQHLLLRDQLLLKNNVNERSISHRLGMYLQDQFPDWDVDCEYNRYRDEVKRLHYVVRDFESMNADREKAVADIDAKTIFPDIIVHKRKKDCNLLVIEMKKGNNNTRIDIDKLKAFTEKGNGYEYAFGLSLVVCEGKPKLKWFINGEEHKYDEVMQQFILKDTSVSHQN